MKKRELFSVYPLPPDLKAQKLRLLQEVGHFWHNASFTHGWSSPPFHYHDVKQELDEACDMVVRIRAHCMKKHADMRTGPGASAEYFWSLHNKPEDKVRFVDQLVEAILSNEDGFEAPLDEALVKRYVASIRDLRKKAHDLKPSHVLKSEWAASELLLDELLHSKGEVSEAEIQQVNSKLKELNELVEAITHRKKQAAEETAKQAEQEARQAAEEMAQRSQAAQEEAARQAEAEAAQKKQKEEEEDDDNSEDSSSDERKRMTASLEKANASKGKLIELKKIDMTTQKIASDVRNFEEIDLARLNDEGLSDKERDGLISRLHKRAMQYAQVLEGELLALDAITGGDELRALRKEQVGKVQKAIDEVDKLQRRLKDLHVAHHEHMDRQRAAEEAQAPAQVPAPAPEKQPSPPPANESSRPPSTEPAATAAAAAAAPNASPPQQDRPAFGVLLAEQPLQVQFQVKERPQSFLISAYVPGVDEETLSIALNDEGTQLLCSGVRVPSNQEMQVLRSHPAVVRFPVHQRDEAMLRLAAGRFGRFSEKWRIDKATVDAEGITASYNSGVIEIVVPKKVQQRRIPQQQRYDPRFAHRSPFGAYW